MKKISGVLKLVVTLTIVALFVWFLFLNPMFTFKGYEKKVTKAAERYFELNPSQLPTGQRVATVSVQKLYYKAYLDEDMYIPYTKNACSVTDSWVKVKQENGKYKYYTYLKCGVFNSNIDHEGPTIKLNGEEELIVNKGRKYEELGVKSVIDKTDGKLDPKDVIIKGKVDTNKVGEYEISYIALDKLKNKTTVKRKVTVIETLENTIKDNTKDTGLYVGDPNNYVRLSGILWRIIDLQGDKVRLVAAEDLANVDFASLGTWLDDFYEKLNDKTKEMMVKNKYCNMNVDAANLNQITDCKSYTNERYIYVPSVIDINRAELNNNNYLRPETISWTANAKDKDNAWLTRRYFVADLANSRYMEHTKKWNYGVRPVITIKSNSKIQSGKGTIFDPYSFGDIKTASGGDLLNTRQMGEYVTYSGILWRIMETEKDGPTKVVSTETIKAEGNRLEVRYDPKNSTIYNPKQKGNVGYFVNNKISEHFKTDYFVNHEITVPIYKDNLKYKKEVSTKKYNVKFSVPNMYDVFSSQPTTESSNAYSYWVINSLNNKGYGTGITEIGVPEIGAKKYTSFGIRAVSYINESVNIVGGKGTKEDPYIIKK